MQRLEEDLGVKVQEVHFPELHYSFQIWDTYMGLPDKEGKVGPPVTWFWAVPVPEYTEGLLDKGQSVVLSVSLLDNVSQWQKAGPVSVTAPIVVCCCPEMFL